MARLPVIGGDEGAWGDILNDFLSQSHTSNGALKSAQVAAAGAEMTSVKGQSGGYAELNDSGVVPARQLAGGISQQTAHVYTACNHYVDGDDLDAFGAFSYSNGSSGVGATITGGGNGVLTANGTAVSIGQRLAVDASNMYGAVPESGVYVVTERGSGSSAYVLTRADDANGSATLGVFFAVKTPGRTVYFSPAADPFVIGSTGVTVASENLSAHTEGGSLATADFSHAESFSTASGTYAHAEGKAVASGYSSHAESQSYAAGDYSHAESNGNASGFLAHAECSAVAEGDNSHAEGMSHATGFLSHAEGGAVAYAFGMHAESSGSSSAQGQFSRVTRGMVTAKTLPFSLTDRFGGRGLVFPDYYRAALIRVRLVARRIDVLGTVSSWTAECMIDGDGTGDYRFIGDPSFTVVLQDAGAASWSVADLAFDSTDHRILEIVVTGASGQTIHWTATIELDEVV